MDACGSNGLGELSVVNMLLLGILGSVIVGEVSAYCMGPDCSAQESYEAG